MNLAKFPRVKLGHLNTPLEPMPRLSHYLNGPEIWIKRDDCTGLATGGNKTRKLEYLMAEAVAMDADIIITQGATQSNHARQTIAAAAKLGMASHIILEDRTHYADQNYKENGNVLLDRLMGATIEYRQTGLDMNAELYKLADALKAKGKRPYAIPGGGSNPTGALGYVNCVLETLNQTVGLGINFDHWVTATGSAGTHAGLIVGLKAMNVNIPLLGIGVRAPKDKQEANVYNLACLTAEKLGCAGVVHPEDVVANCDYIGEGYGIPAKSTLEAISIFAKLEGILLDPVYSGKGAAGLIDLVRKGHFKKGEKIMFLHTGGAVALSGYPFAMNDIL